MKKRERFIAFLERILGITRSAPSARVIIIPDDIRNSIRHSGDPRLYDSHHSFVASYESLFPRQSGQEPQAEVFDSRTASIDESHDNPWTSSTLNQVLTQSEAHKHAHETESGLDRAVDFLWKRKIIVAFVLYIVLAGIFTVLYIFGFVPESLKTENFRDFNISDLRLTVEANPRTHTSTPVEAAAHTATSSVLVQAHATTTHLATAQTARPATIAGTPAGTTGSANVKKPPVAATIPVMYGENPVYIEALTVGLSVKISNPASADNATLDDYLKKGGIRYPGSQGLGIGRNTLLMGHSTSFKVVNNQAYKAFNGVKLLKVGDIVTVRSLTTAYHYRVTSNIMAKNSEVYVDFEQAKNMITLVTCNVLGAKEDRYIVTAEFMSSTPL